MTFKNTGIFLFIMIVGFSAIRVITIFATDTISNEINEIFSVPYYQVQVNTFEMNPPKSVEDEKQLVFSKIIFNERSVQIVLYPSYRVFVADYYTNDNVNKNDYASECTFVNPDNQMEYTIRPAAGENLKDVQQIELLYNNAVVQIFNRSSSSNN